MFNSVRRITVALVCGLVVFLVFQVQWVGAVDYNSQINQLRQKRETLSREIIRNRQKALQKKKEAKKISSEIKKIDGNIAETQNRINLLQGQIDEVKSQIEEKVKQIRQKEDELGRERENQAQALRAIYETTDQSLVYILFSSDDISEIVDRSSYLEALEVRIDKTIELMIQIRDDLTAQKEELKKKDEELGGFKKQQEAYRKGLRYQKGKKDTLLYQTKSIQKKLEKQIEEIKKYYQQIQSQLNDLFKKGRRTGRIKSKDKGTSAVGFSLPMDYDYVSYNYGPTDASYPYYPIIKFHTGIDFVNKACGSPVYAAADGVANLFSTRLGYGNYIILGHNDRYSTLYGHLQGYNVADGEEVKKGDIIGFEGTTGWSTGCHLHFEVREYGEHINPWSVLP